MSPVVDGNLVIVSAAISNWGTSANRSHRLVALDKRTGDIVYVSNPGGRPYDTAYASPLIATINGMRLLITGLGDGAIHAIKPQTGEKVWSFVAAKRAINTGVVVMNNQVLVSHGDENTEGHRARAAGLDRRFADRRHQDHAVGGERDRVRLLVAAASTARGSIRSMAAATLHAYEIETGTALWELSLGTAQKAPPVMADGKIYVGTDNGKFHIIRPHVDRGEILSSVELPVSTNSCCGSEGTPEQILGGAAVSRGRIFFVSSDAVYAIGARRADHADGPRGGRARRRRTRVLRRTCRSSPTELVIEPGKAIKLTARLFDAQGRFLRDEPPRSGRWTG